MLFRSLKLMSMIAVSLFFVALATAQPTTPLETQIERIQRATIFVYQVQDVQDSFHITCVSSGTIVSRDGLILTNAHGTSQSETCPGDAIVIAISTDLQNPPVPLYRARIRQTDPGLDLALLQIVQNIDGRQINPDELALPFVELGNSAQVSLDDTLTVVGYNGLGDQPVQTVRATVVNFTTEPTGERTWQKLNVAVPGVMTGGGAYNRDGQLIGIPTIAPVANETSDIDCIVVQDTNGDRLVNSEDICVPLGRSINALRASQFALPLFRAAALNLETNLDFDADQTEFVASDEEPEVSRLFFSSSVNDAGMPTSIVTSLPTGATSLYLFFDYDHMTPVTTYELRVTTGNIPNPTYSLPPVRWSGGTSGMWYTGSDQNWENGVYDFTLFIDGIAQATASIVIGGAPADEATLSDLVFGLSDLEGTPLGNGFVLPVGNTASARFIHRNMTSEIEMVERWLYEGAEFYRASDPWSMDVFGADGARTLSIRDVSNLSPGRYRLEIYLNGRLAATSDFSIAGAAQGAFPQVFTDAHYTDGPTDASAAEAVTISSFSAGVDSLYAVFDWQQIQRGTSWTVRWLVDGTVFYEETLRWRQENSGENFLLALEGNPTVPDGTYRLEVYVGQVQLASAEATVGIGQLSIDRFSGTEGLQLRGTIIDTDTGRGIPGVTFVLLTEEFSVADFVWDSEQIFALATTDRNGFFEVDRLLEISTEARSIPYSVVIQAEGYLPITQDGFVVDAETENPLELTIYLTRE